MKHFLPQPLLNDLFPVSIDLIGSGGTGSQMLTALARINHGLLEFGRKGLTVRVFDNDRISESNIGRQLFSHSDIGKYKSQVLIDRCNRFFGTNWEFSTSLYPCKKCSGANIIISCVDNAKSRHNIYNTFKNGSYDAEFHPYYFMDFGNSKTSGQIVLGTFNQIVQPEGIDDTVSFLPTIIDMYPNLSDEGDNTPSCSLAEALVEQDMFINTTLIPFGGTLLWNLLKNFNISIQGAYINLSEFKVVPIPI